MSRRLWATRCILGRDIFRPLFLSAAEIKFSALPSKIDKVDKIEKGLMAILWQFLEKLDPEQNSR
jgi:hypothetical protein